MPLCVCRWALGVLVIEIGALCYNHTCTDFVADHFSPSQFSGRFKAGAAPDHPPLTFKYVNVTTLSSLFRNLKSPMTRRKGSLRRHESVKAAAKLPIAQIAPQNEMLAALNKVVPYPPRETICVLASAVVYVDNPFFGVGWIFRVSICICSRVSLE